MQKVSIYDAQAKVTHWTASFATLFQDQSHSPMENASRYKLPKVALPRTPGTDMNLGAKSKGMLSSLLQKLARLDKLFVGIVIIPTLVTAIYYGIIASDVYVSESRFVVRQPEQKSQSTTLGMILQTAGISDSRSEAYAVVEFILSRDALRQLDEKINFRNAYTADHIDQLSRFNPLGLDDSFEALHAYYRKQVTVELDATSGIAYSKVRGFTPEDAYKINTELLRISESLINKLNDRARNDMIRFAQKDVEDAEADFQSASLVLTAYKDKEILFDPGAQSTLQLQQIGKLQAELIEVRGQLAQYRAFATESPFVKTLEKRGSELQRQINTEMAKIAGGNDSMTQKLIEFERLTLDRTFMDKRLAAALMSLEQARSEARRQHLYLEMIVTPNAPDGPMYPRRVRDIFFVSVASLLIFGILKMLLLGIREHHA